VAVAKEACERIDRDPATLETSMLVFAIVDEEATVDLIPEDFRPMAVFGSAESVADQINTKIFDAGVGGVILSPLTAVTGYQPGRAAEVAQKLTPVLAR
jgi:hypothetical protein